MSAPTAIVAKDGQHLASRKGNRSFARGVLIGLAIVTPFWIVVAILLAWLL